MKSPEINEFGKKDKIHSGEGIEGDRGERVGPYSSPS